MLVSSGKDSQMLKNSAKPVLQSNVIRICNKDSPIFNLESDGEEQEGSKEDHKEDEVQAFPGADRELSSPPKLLSPKKPSPCISRCALQRKPAPQSKTQAKVNPSMAVAKVSPDKA